LACPGKTSKDNPDLVGNLDYEKVVRQSLKVKGGAGEGEQLFQQQACFACHTTSQNQPLKGPFLGDITDRYSDRKLLESILKPDAQFAQGFATARFNFDGGIAQPIRILSSSRKVPLTPLSARSCHPPEASRNKHTGERGMFLRGLLHKAVKTITA
jgi:cytochrome c551/c552